MTEDPLLIALAILNGPYILSLLTVLTLRSGAAWTLWAPAQWFGPLSESWLFWGPAHMGYLLGLAAWLQGWAIAHRVAAVCLLIWFCNGLVLRITRAGSEV